MEFNLYDIHIAQADALECYGNWPRPTVIVSDGPYGLGIYPGEPTKPNLLPDHYLPHLLMWSEKARFDTTLWFWNSEEGWANTHSTIVNNGWEFRNCHIWDKGMAHVSGNINTKTIRKFPVVTEVCVQYVRRVEIPYGDEQLTLKDWLRKEWERTGLPFSKTNEACGVKNAATRKYFTKCDLWYFPPSSAFERIVQYANAMGAKTTRPYFSIDGTRPLTGSEWESFRAKFKCEHGINNVWRHSAVRGNERLKSGSKSIHMNQKPIELLRSCIRASSDQGDVVWEPFGGLCSASIAAAIENRISYAAEINLNFWQSAKERVIDFYENREFPVQARTRQELGPLQLVFKS